ncbi:MAG: AIR synthase-related protein [Planctomycetota bacterium]
MKSPRSPRPAARATRAAHAARAAHGTRGSRAAAPAAAAEAGRYQARGVSSSKQEVHAAIEKLDAGLYPRAFCKILPDFAGGDRRFCNVIHADGPGTKSLIAYLHWRETGDAAVFAGIAQDSIVMNLDDLLCVGVTGGMTISSTLNRNARSIPGAVLAALIAGTEKVLADLRRVGVEIHSGGGETADVGDLTRTLVADTTLFARWPRRRILAGNGILPGLAIVGLASAGQAAYEAAENSGIGSNGLTSARHDLLNKYYARKYPETFDAATPKKLVYCGRFRLEDPLPGSRQTVGAALLSPTRTYAPILRPLLEGHFARIAGLIHCSGGGQTKCLRFGRGVHFVKDALLDPPPIFACIQHDTRTPWREMFQVFNMGHRMEVYCRPFFAPTVIAAAREHNVAAAVIGRTEPSQRPDGANHLSIVHAGQRFEYSL